MRFGQQLKGIERFMLVAGFNGFAVIQDIKAGRLVVARVSGKTDTYHLIDKAFDPQSLADVAMELMKRGVTVFP